MARCKCVAEMNPQTWLLRACGETRVKWVEAAIVARPTVYGPVKPAQLGQVVRDRNQAAQNDIDVVCALRHVGDVSRDQVQSLGEKSGQIADVIRTVERNVILSLP